MRIGDGDDGYGNYFEYPEENSFSDGARVNDFKASAQFQVMLFQPIGFDEVKEIATQLAKKIPVVLNLERCDSESARRILDFLNGAVYMERGATKRIAARPF